VSGCVGGDDSDEFIHQTLDIDQVHQNQFSMPRPLDVIEAERARVSQLIDLVRSIRSSVFSAFELVAQPDTAVGSAAQANQGESPYFQFGFETPTVVSQLRSHQASIQRHLREAKQLWAALPTADSIPIVPTPADEPVTPVDRVFQALRARSSAFTASTTVDHHGNLSILHIQIKPVLSAQLHIADEPQRLRIASVAVSAYRNSNHSAPNAQHIVFSRITGHAMEAIQHFFKNSTDLETDYAALSNFLVRFTARFVSVVNCISDLLECCVQIWLDSYRTLFTAPCAVCHRLLASDQFASIAYHALTSDATLVNVGRASLLPPTIRTLQAYGSESQFTPVHAHCAMRY
jgi:hypothetical protein